MPRKVIDLEAVRQADAKLKQLLEDHPELREPDPERQQALQDWLRQLDMEETDNDETDR